MPVVAGEAEVEPTEPEEPELLDAPPPGGMPINLEAPAPSSEPVDGIEPPAEIAPTPYGTWPLDAAALARPEPPVDPEVYTVF